MTRFSPTSGTTSARVPIAAIFTKAGSHASRPERAQSACTTFNATPTPARCLSAYVQSRRFGLITASACGSVPSGSWWSVMMRSMPEIARALRRFDAADPAIHRHHHARAVGVQTLDRRGLQAVAILQPVGDEVHDVAAQQLEAAAEDDRRRDAVDVVVPVDGNALAAADRGQQPIDGRLHVGEPEWVEQVIEGRIQEAAGRIGRIETAQAQQPRRDGLDAECALQRVGRAGRRRASGSR